MAWMGLGNKPQFQPCSVQDYVAGYLMAMGAMAALHRRTTEGGSWLVRTSLAAAGKWVRDFGLVPAELLADVNRELPQAVVAPFLMDKIGENTSELQSLMRSSYAVFCLQK